MPGEIVADPMNNAPHGQALGPPNVAEESKDDIRAVNSEGKSDVNSDGESEVNSEGKSGGKSDARSDGNSDQSSGDGNLSQRSGDGNAVTSASAKLKTKPVVKTEPVMSINRQYHFDESLAEHTYTHTHIHTYTYTEKGGGSRKS